MITLEKAKQKAERRAGKEVIQICEDKKAWILTYSFDDCDDFVAISKKTGLFLNYDIENVETNEIKVIWAK